MTKGLNALVVSLTKNGYFKVAEIIKKHPKNEIIDNLCDVYDGINIDAAQIKVMLSYNDTTNEFPEVWDEVRTLGDSAVEALVFISIIYSHNKLINVLSKSKLSEMRGCLRREDLDKKAYTNLVYSMSQLNLCPLSRGEDETYYDISPLFLLEIGPLVKKIIGYKLRKTGWTDPALDDYFSRSFYEQCAYYGFHDVLGISIEQFKQWLEGDEVKKEEPPKLDVIDLSIETSAVLISALSSKPFVILAGTTGTGKTKTIRDLVAKINPFPNDPEFNHAFIPVEAGWTDGRHLLGYKNPFGRSGENYVSTKLIDTLLKSNHPEYSNTPFFIILDEMNLSHVEMYFSKFLSVMETSQDENPEPILGLDELSLLYKSGVTDPIKTTYILNAINKKGLYITSNVFFIGTVNMDETTYMFSPKVLDRAFVIQYAPPKPSTVGYEFKISEEDKLGVTTNALSSFMTRNLDISLSSKYDNYLDELFDALGQFKFGPRTTNEVRRYISICNAIAEKFDSKEGYNTKVEVLDRITVQKILPKIHGNRDTLNPIFVAMNILFDKEGLIQSKKKLEQMRKNVTNTGFANYFSS
ncbi:hypothetical protein ACTXIP_01450 [Psychrobacter alimentarius]|uniref:hypothetical protein n=1 Tax=Psychrobacter alimentarius TaxID=261164 RepID=UPI003FD3E6B6